MLFLPLECLKRYFLKVLQRLSEFVYHYQSLKSFPSCNWQNRVFRPSIQQSLEQEKPKKDLENDPQEYTQIDLKCNQNSQNTQLNLSGDVVVGLESFLSHYVITFVVCQKIVFQMGVKGFRKSHEIFLHFPSNQG